MLAYLPLGAQPLSTLPAGIVVTDDTIVSGAFDNDADAFDLRGSDELAYDTVFTAPLADAPVVTDDTFVAGSFGDAVFVELTDEVPAAFDAWIASPFEGEPGAPPPPPPQPGPLSQLGGAGWFAEVPASRRKKQKPIWPNLPAPSPGAAQPWRLVTVTRETARLRIHRSAKAMRAKLKRDTNLEDHVIAGIVAALMADQDKDN
jgi:hypothetical protein